MRVGNVAIVGLGGVGLALAGVIAWRGRRLPAVAPRSLPTAVGASALDAMRTLSAIGGAGLVAGLLVPGLGGRLLMRALAATSGTRAQGKLTEADEVVGAITFDGSLGFVIFVGLVLPFAAALGYLALRHYLPGRAAAAGVGFGVILLALFGVDDPLSPDNVDFDILSPLWLAVGGIVGLGLLFGVTFSALAARFDARLRPLSGGLRTVPGHAPFLLGLLPPFAAVTVPYVGLRAALRGRTAPALTQGTVRSVGRVVVGLATAAAAVITLVAAAEIL
ncbi:MAG: hypothetical protein WDA60_04155 [Acidimicrobiia bacterium]|jgi:hypothetical protein